MEWTTVYIKGKGDFQAEVRKRLESSAIDFMPGYMESPGRSDLYWISETTSLRTVKEAIGSKVIFRHRLRFYTTLESFTESNFNYYSIASWTLAVHFQSGPKSVTKLVPSLLQSWWCHALILRHRKKWYVIQSRYCYCYWFLPGPLSPLSMYFPLFH